MSRTDLEIVHEVLRAFPARPLRVTQSYGGVIAYHAMLVALCVIAAATIAYLNGGPIARDWALVGRAVAAPAIRVDPECTIHSGVFWSCKMVFRSVDTKRTVLGQSEIAFWSIRSSTFAARALRSPDSPLVLTTDFALEHLWNRTVSLAAMCLVFLLIAAGCAAAARPWMRAFVGLRGLSGRKLTPITVRLRATPDRVARLEAFGQRHIFFESDGRQYSSVMRTSQMPFRLPGALALAVRSQSHTKPIVLDADLRMLDFTGAERLTLVEALTREAS